MALATGARIDGLRIRHVEPADYEGFHAVMCGPGVVRGTLQMPLASKEGWREKLATLDPAGAMLVAEVPSSQAPSGYQIVANAGLHPVGSSPRRRHAMDVGMAIRDDWQRRGVGSVLMTALLDRADNWMNVLRLELTVFVDNEAACKLYQRFGFEVEGTLRAYALRDGAFVDAYAMARLHPKPPRRTPEGGVA